MTNSRMSKEIRNPKLESIAREFIMSISYFVLNHSFDIRHSDFVIVRLRKSIPWVIVRSSCCAAATDASAKSVCAKR